MTTMRERVMMRLLAYTVLIVAAALLLAPLAGCDAVQKQMGGQVIGASVTLMGVTVSASGTIPTAPAVPAP